MLYAGLILAAAAVIILDQVTKFLVIANIPMGGTVQAIPGLFHFTHIHNEGAAFSMLSGQRWFFILLTIVFLIAVVVIVKKRVLGTGGLWILALITGGAIGNLIDRVINGYVEDMIALDFMNFAVFNVADMFLTCGAVALIVYVFVTDEKKKKGQGK